MGFLLVDRLVEFTPGKAARGVFAPAPEVVAVPSFMVAEAIGQLAGWLAVEKADFRSRPVAGLAHEVWSSGFTAAGKVFDLEATLRSYSNEAIVYEGRATLDGVEVVRVTNCIGPMLPMEDFDDPEAVRRRFIDLRERGEENPLAPDTLDGLSLVIEERERGKRIRALLDVPFSVPFFADHFPRKPVLPATIILDYGLQLACDATREALGREPEARVKETRLRSMKIRQFTPPGTRLELETKVTSASSNQGLLSFSIRRAPQPGARADGEGQGRALGTARAEVILEQAP